ncbi:MAG: HEAT repeat domain-containing protein [Chlamydiia bacterium]|nr:HEAT repeat domain-containing protein [Chlamydiia bacterium]
MKWTVFLFLFASLQATGQTLSHDKDLFATETQSIKRIHSHLLIRDYSSALLECEESIHAFPDSEGIKRSYVRALAENGKDDEAIAKWKLFGLKNEAIDPNLVEALAWGVLNRSENSPQFVVNIASLMSAYYTNDIRAVRMLFHQLNSSNALLRAMAAQLSPRYRDHLLIDELIRLLNNEKVWFVRLEVIKALGMMEIKELKEPLKRIVTHSRTTAEEKGVAIASLVNTYESIGDEELSKLVHSKRSGLRHLACQIVSHLDLHEKVSFVELLLDDPNSDVRIAALSTLYFMGLKSLSPSALTKIIDLTEDSHPPVALTAAWVVSNYAPETALQVVRKWVYSSDESSRRLAAFILGRIGDNGKSLSHEVLKVSPDPFVKANLALGGIGQGGKVDHLSDTLYTFLALRKGKVMWDSSQNPLFQILAPSSICHVPQVPEYPAMIDQLTRLDILEMLMKLKHPKAIDAVKSFLTHQALGVTYAASNALVEEGGEEALTILRTLMREESGTVRIQAALVLALAGKDVEAIDVLQKGYFSSDREMKVNILGALGYIGDKTSIPFLMNLLEEPYQILKVVAASALIQCVYH